MKMEGHINEEGRLQCIGGDIEMDGLNHEKIELQGPIFALSALRVLLITTEKYRRPRWTRTMDIALHVELGSRTPK